MEIKPLSSRQDLLKFIKFPFELYGADPLWVAPLISEQLKFFYYKAKIPTLRVTIMGVLPQYKLRGIDVVMYYKSFQAAYAHKNQFKSAEFSWVLESNEMMNKVATSLGGKIYKTYRFYDLQISASTENGGTNV